MQPNFFIVGAPKSGTTSLFHYLDQHPQVFMSAVKEPCYFASEIRPENFSAEYRKIIVSSGGPDLRRGDPKVDKRFSGVAATWQDYLALFDGATGEAAIGEASVCYLWSPTAARNIFARIPNARIIAVLRHPADRAWSQYLQGVANGHVRRSFRAQIDACIASHEEQFSPTHPFLEFGMYCRQIKTYFDLFPRENIRIYFYQDGLAAIVADVFRFLNVNPAFSPDLSRRHLEAATSETGTALFRMLRKYNLWHSLRKLAPASVRPLFRKLAFRRRAVTPMNHEDRRFLCEYYKEDVQRLALLVNRDLTSWYV
jgi:hypothetical protein